MIIKINHGLSHIGSLLAVVFNFPTNLKKGEQDDQKKSENKRYPPDIDR